MRPTVVLLNMIIAVMSESVAQAREVSQLVAMFERAKVVLTWEKRWRRSRKSRWSLNRLVHWCLGKRHDRQTPFPRWLHVLAPADTAAQQPAAPSLVHPSPPSAQLRLRRDQHGRP